jgi:hypothetical protein
MSDAASRIKKMKNKVRAMLIEKISKPLNPRMPAIKASIKSVIIRLIMVTPL